MTTREEWLAALDANHDDASTLGDIARSILDEHETVEEAVREEREAVVHYLEAFPGHGYCGGIDAEDAVCGIRNGDHRK